MVVVSGVVIFGLLWRQSEEHAQNGDIYDYHLASARWAEMIEKEIALLSVRSNRRNIQTDALQEEDRDHDEGIEQGALYSIKKKLALLKEKNEQYGGMSSTLVLDKLVEVDERLRSFMDAVDTSGEGGAETFEEIMAAYTLRVGQLDRIHRKLYSEHLVTATLRRRQSDNLLFGIFSVVILGGGFLAMLLTSRIARSEVSLRDGGRLLEAVANNVPGGVFRCKVNSSNDIEVLYQSVGIPAVLGGRTSIGDKDWSTILEATHPDDRDDVLQKSRQSSHTGEDLSCDGNTPIFRGLQK
jgi:hypothetical protein